MPPSPKRFQAVEKLLHWYVAISMLVLLITGTALFVPALSAHIPRPLLNRIHIDTGLTAAIAIPLSLLGPWGRSLRQDLRELMVAPVVQLESWSGVLGDWLHRSRPAPTTQHPQRFNVGQRIFTAAIAALFVVGVLTGLALRTPGRTPLFIQGGAEFTHEIVYLAILVLVVGHIAKVIGAYRGRRHAVADDRIDQN